jgi:hypothetical protein
MGFYQPNNRLRVVPVAGVQRVRAERLFLCGDLSGYSLDRASSRGGPFSENPADTRDPFREPFLSTNGIEALGFGQGSPIS